METLIHRGIYSQQKDSMVTLCNTDRILPQAQITGTERQVVSCKKCIRLLQQGVIMLDGLRIPLGKYRWDAEHDKWVKN